MTVRRRQRFGTIATWVVAIVVAALPWALWTVARENTLHENGRWRNAKVDCRKGLIGGVMARVTRVMTHRNRLDLGAWFGFQEVFLDEPRVLERVSFRMRLVDSAYLTVLVDDGGEHFAHCAGVRFSRNAGFPSAMLRTGAKRRFESVVPYRFHGVRDDGWRRIELEFADGMCTFSVDGTASGSFPLEPAGAARRLGFRGSERSAYVDDVVVVGRSAVDGAPFELVESFDAGERLPVRFLLIAAALAAVAGLVFRLVAERAARSGRRADVYPLAVVVLTGALGWGVWILDWVWLGGRYPENVLDVPKGYENTMFRPEVAETTWDERYPRKVGLPKTTILFLGGSQTWGSGATIFADSWTRLVERRLNEALPKRGILCVNRARSGAKVAEMAAKARDRWLAEHEPDLVVANHGHNDSDPVAFGEGLVELWQATQDAGARLVLIAEPNCFEQRSAQLASNHHIMRTLAAGRVPVLEMQAPLDARRDDGFLWWDCVHLSSAGQEVFAEIVSELLLEQLR